jgi:hypothetical protein
LHNELGYLPTYPRKVIIWLIHKLLHGALSLRTSSHYLSWRGLGGWEIVF